MFLLMKEVAAYLCVTEDWVRRERANPQSQLSRVLKVGDGRGAAVRVSSCVLAEFVVERSEGRIDALEEGERIVAFVERLREGVVAA